MYKTLFGNELVINTKIMIDKKRITQYSFNNEILKRERTLYDFRFNAKNKRD